MSSMEFHIQAIQQELADLEREWEDHSCVDEAKAVTEGEIEEAWDSGRADLKRKLLDDIETWKAAVGLMITEMSLDNMERWVKRS